MLLVGDFREIPTNRPTLNGGGGGDWGYLTRPVQLTSELRRSTHMKFCSTTFVADCPCACTNTGAGSKWVQLVC
ncbi:hypothetical protein HOLleu_42342 [Holothuria leucospilota]|uniref:Uncharacterized protein n=1 Tax=Holothuria leucospilota TaxID=206669 RepID=A0A9Q0YAY0_HOLLE|nr:hypothetical protein HOLleu_42342 [Holothuria leucospilota]